jgi:hypothetical protein
MEVPHILYHVLAIVILVTVRVNESYCRLVIDSTSRPKIGQLDMACSINKNVFWFDIPTRAAVQIVD